MTITIEEKDFVCGACGTVSMMALPTKISTPCVIEYECSKCGQREFSKTNCHKILRHDDSIPPTTPTRPPSEGKLKSAKLVRCENLPPETRKQYGLPDSGLAVHEVREVPTPTTEKISLVPTPNDSVPEGKPCLICHLTAAQTRGQTSRHICKYEDDSAEAKGNDETNKGMRHQQLQPHKRDEPVNSAPKSDAPATDEEKKILLSFADDNDWHAYTEEARAKSVSELRAFVQKEVERASKLAYENCNRELNCVGEVAEKYTQEAVEKALDEERARMAAFIVKEQQALMVHDKEIVEKALIEDRKKRPLMEILGPHATKLKERWEKEAVEKALMERVERDIATCELYIKEHEKEMVEKAMENLVEPLSLWLWRNEVHGGHFSEDYEPKEEWVALAKEAIKAARWPGAKKVKEVE